MYEINLMHFLKTKADYIALNLKCILNIFQWRRLMYIIFDIDIEM
jgi:hypothetical protein